MDDPAPSVDATSKPARRFRRTRIAISVFFGVVTLALCVLWVRSYWHLEVLRRFSADKWRWDATSEGGMILINSERMGLRTKPRWQLIHFDTKPALRAPRFSFSRSSSQTRVEFPHLIFPLIAISAAVLPWLPWRFSLRTMLIATAVLAVVLGLGVWLAR